MVPVHQELREVLYNVVYYRTSNGPIIGVSRQAADQWVQQALASAEKAGAIAPRQADRNPHPPPQLCSARVGPRHAVNQLEAWLGHESLGHDRDLLALSPGTGGRTVSIP